MSKAFSEIQMSGGGGFITQTRYSGNTATYNVAQQHTLNPRTKYIVADVVAGGGGGQGGYNIGNYAHGKYGGCGGGGGASVLGVVYFIRPEDNSQIPFKAGAAGQGSVRNMPASKGGDSYLGGCVSCSGGEAMNYSLAEFTEWVTTSGSSAYSGGYIFFSALTTLGGKVHFPQTVTGLSPREPSSVAAAADGGWGGAGAIYFDTATKGGRANNSEPDNLETAFGTIQGGIVADYHIHTAATATTPARNDAPGGGGGATLRGKGGHGLFIGIYDTDWSAGKYGSGGGGGSVTQLNTDNPTATTSIGANGGAGYVWIREFG